MWQPHFVHRRPTPTSPLRSLLLNCSGEGTPLASSPCAGRRLYNRPITIPSILSLQILVSDNRVFFIFIATILVTIPMKKTYFVCNAFFVLVWILRKSGSGVSGCTATVDCYSLSSGHRWKARLLVWARNPWEWRWGRAEITSSSPSVLWLLTTWERLVNNFIGFE